MKRFGKTSKKEVDALKFLSLSNTTDELNQTESIFTQNQISGLIRDRLKEIIKLQNSINLNKLDYEAKSKKKKKVISEEIHCLLHFQNTYMQIFYQQQMLIKNKVIYSKNYVR